MEGAAKNADVPRAIFFKTFLRDTGIQLYFNIF